MSIYWQMKKKLPSNFPKKEKKLLIKKASKSFLWFLIGVILGLFFLVSFVFILFQNKYKNVVYSGVSVNGINFGGKTQSEIKDFFVQKNTKIEDIKFVFHEPQNIATISAKQINLGYDSDLIAEQAYSIGRSKNILSNITLILSAYINGDNLPPSYRYSESQFLTFIKPITQNIDIQPTDALFTFKDGKVTAFRPSLDGVVVDIEELKNKLSLKIPYVVALEKPQIVIISIPIKVVKPKVTTDQANSMGIKELIGKGTSLFQHSIVNRIHNITLASTRLNGILIAPNEVFSFNKAVGDISAFTGYKQAYVIENGKTVLGDGGGVCQVSTTLFRAALDAGLPIT